MEFEGVDALVMVERGSFELGRVSFFSWSDISRPERRLQGERGWQRRAGNAFIGWKAFIGMTGINLDMVSELSERSHIQNESLIPDPAAGLEPIFSPRKPSQSTISRETRLSQWE
jgi:hypothetical protein